MITTAKIEVLRNQLRIAGEKLDILREANLKKLTGTSDDMKAYDIALTAFYESLKPIADFNSQEQKRYQQTVTAMAELGRSQHFGKRA